MKQRLIASPADAQEIEALAKVSGHRALAQIAALHEAEPLDVLWRMKTGALGCDPLDADAPLNLIEQLNQTFTYIASARAAQVLLERHAELAPFRLNLGTLAGSDIESPSGELCAEVFAAVTPHNNRKLRNDIVKVNKRTEARLRYVFFMCPGYDPGVQPRLSRDGVTVYSLGNAM